MTGAFDADAFLKDALTLAHDRIKNNPDEFASTALVQLVREALRFLEAQQEKQGDGEREPSLEEILDLPDFPAEKKAVLVMEECRRLRERLMALEDWLGALGGSDQ